MATNAYFAWVRDGRPFELIRPCQRLRDTLVRHGYTVYSIGNDDHLMASTPEDHTPFSATGWPGKAKYGFGYALDIMPPAPGAKSKVNGKPLPSLQQLGAQIAKDRNANVAGISWLKYMNWEPQRDNGGPCYHDSWQPTFARNGSGDRGHIHISARTGVESSAVGDTYDPVARIYGGDIDMADAADVATEVIKRMGPIFGRVEALFSNRPTNPSSNADPTKQEKNQLRAALDILATGQAAILAAVGQVDEAVVAQLTGPLVTAITTALTASLGDVDTDELEAAVKSGVREVLGSLDES